MRMHEIAGAIGLVITGGLSFAGSQDLPDEVVRRVDAVFAPWDRADSPGCALGIYRDGELLYGRGFGMASLELRVPISTHTRFHLASTSKQFTAFAVHLLARDGTLSLDDEVREHVPELPDYGTPITLRHLIHHTSGIRDYIVLLNFAGFRMDRDWQSLDETLGVIVAQRATNFAPGDRYEYSNSGYWLLALVVERVSGASMAEFCEQRVFGPLDMDRTLVQDDLFQVIPDVAEPYDRTGGGFRIFRDSFLAKGDGWVFTCIEDLGKWDRNFDHPKVGDAEFARDILRPWIHPDGNGDYAAGLSLGSYRGLPTVRHSGGSAGWGAQFLRFPGTGITIAVLSNLGDVNPPDLALRVADVVLDDRLEIEARVPLPAANVPVEIHDVAPDDLASLTGDYVRPRKGTTIRVVLDGGVLRAHIGSRSFVLGAVEFDGFQLLDYNRSEHARFLRFRRGADGDVEGAVFEGEQMRDGPWILFRVMSFDADDLAEYFGRYRSEELGAVYRLAFANGGIEAWVKHARSERRLIGPLIRYDEDGFAGDGAGIRFERNGAGDIVGFRLSAPDFEGIVFERIP